MITLRQLPYIDILSLNDMMSFDTKVNIIEHCKLARIDYRRVGARHRLQMLWPIYSPKTHYGRLGFDSSIRLVQLVGGVTKVNMLKVCDKADYGRVKIVDNIHRII